LGGVDYRTFLGFKTLLKKNVGVCREMVKAVGGGPIGGHGNNTTG